MIKLAKVKMPGKKPEPEFDMSELGAEEGEEMAEGEAEPVSELEAVSDEDLIAEMKKRGLNLESLDSEGASPDEEQYI